MTLEYPASAPSFLHRLSKVKHRKWQAMMGSKHMQLKRHRTVSPCLSASPQDMHEQAILDSVASQCLSPLSLSHFETCVVKPIKGATVIQADLKEYKSIAHCVIWQICTRACRESEKSDE